MRKVIIDCDPGHDDALAILLAVKHLDVLGLTTVAGNQQLEKVTMNALKVLECAGRPQIPVARGMSDPLVGSRGYEAEIDGPDVHGESGLDGPFLPSPVTAIDDRHAVDFIIDMVMATEDITLVPTGPLTNVATALRREPRIAERLTEISLMGGNLTIGNVTSTAEFNIYVDPEAAHVVFTSGVPIKMCGINLTRQVMITEVEIEQIRTIGNSVSDVVAEWMTFYLGTVRKLFDLPGGALHDPCAVAALIDPTLIHFEPMHVDIELIGQHTYGMTVCDYRHIHMAGDGFTTLGPPQGNPPNAKVGLCINRDRFFQLLMDTLALYD